MGALNSLGGSVAMFVILAAEALWKLQSRRAAERAVLGRCAMCEHPIGERRIARSGLVLCPGCFARLDRRSRIATRMLDVVIGLSFLLGLVAAVDLLRSGDGDWWIGLVVCWASGFMLIVLRRIVLRFERAERP